jgi:hypothetical protein
MTVARTADPATDLRLARLHVRMGQLGLARAELESLAGSADLGEDGLLALAEVRWRTADLTGAGEAADAYLSGGGDAAIGFVIASEAMVAAGQTTEARDLAARALDAADVPIDQIFAGMPRSTIWPVDTADAGLGSGALSGDRQPLRRARSTILQPSEIHLPIERHPPEPGFWDGDESAPPESPDPAAILDSARDALSAGRVEAAAVRFAVVLRSAPELAPAVLAATDVARPRSPEIEIVRGDAFRVVGHEIDAARSWGIAAADVRSGSGPASDRTAVPNTVPAAAVADPSTVPQPATATERATATEPSTATEPATATRAAAASEPATPEEAS